MAVVASFIGTVSYLEAQKLEPNAPVKYFKLPMFGEDGYKIWDLQGSEGRYISNDRIEVDGMKLQTWSGQIPLVLELTIESPHAVLLPSENKATGPDFIYIVDGHGNFSIVGRDWEWKRKDQQDRTIVRNDVRVTFKQSLGSILE